MTEHMDKRGAQNCSLSFTHLPIISPVIFKACKHSLENDKNKQVLTLGNIDAEILKALLNELYSGNDIVEFAQRKLNESQNEIEKNLLNNFLTINDHFENYTSEERLKLKITLRNLFERYDNL